MQTGQGPTQRVPKLVHRVKAAIDQYHMVRAGDLWVVAVSGGADSVALLHVLRRLAPSIGLRLHVAHLNHGLRGEIADADAAFVGALAGALGIPITLEKRDVPRLRQELVVSIETAARLARYSFLAETAADIGAAGVAVGHTADDQAETVLLHWLRGAGLGGQQGMLPVSELSGTDPERPSAGRWRVRLFRPLLDATRAEVEEYCQAEALEFRTDASNYEIELRRNWVRHELLPFVERQSPGARKTLARSARLAAQDLDYLQQKILALWPGLATEEDGRIAFDLPTWTGLHPVEQRYLLREAVCRLLGSTEDLSEANLEEALRVMAHGTVGGTVIWPRGLRLVKGYGELVLTSQPFPEPGDLAAGPFPPGGEVPLIVPGVTAFGAWDITAERRVERCADHDPWHADLDYGAVTEAMGGGGLSVRSRRPGDRLCPLGMESEKKLQDIMVDAKIPRAQRNSWPIVVSSGRIVWVPGCRIAHRARVTPETMEILCLRAARRPRR